MRIVVLGAGVVGTAAAYYLARDGHEVTVVERHRAPARGTSQSNAGLVSPGDATAWASPAALKTFIQALYTPDLGIRVKLRLDPYFLAWTWRFLRQCTTARLRANTQVKLRLALYSRDCINALSPRPASTMTSARRASSISSARRRASTPAPTTTGSSASMACRSRSSAATGWSSWSRALPA